MPHADMDIVSPSIHVLARQSMDKFNSMSSNKFSAFQQLMFVVTFRHQALSLTFISDSCVSSYYYGIIHVKN